MITTDIYRKCDKIVIENYDKRPINPPLSCASEVKKGEIYTCHASCIVSCFWFCYKIDPAKGPLFICIRDVLFGECVGRHYTWADFGGHPVRLSHDLRIQTLFEFWPDDDGKEVTYWQ